MSPRRFALVWLIGACSCDKPPSPVDRGQPAQAQSAPPPRCRPTPAGDVVAQWTARDGCPIAVRAVAGALQLESLALAPSPPVVGPAPTCRVAGCRYEGVDTELGPMLIATEPGAQSEVPTAVFLGVVAGGRLVFVDLWAGAGPAVIEDSTAVGPAHALAPLRCGDDLGLFARPRVPGMEHLAVPPTLAEREGILALGVAPGVTDEAVTLRPGASTGCRPLAVPLP